MYRVAANVDTCPQCGIDLVPATAIGDIHYQSCGQCLGAWLARGAVMRMWQEMQRGISEPQPWTDFTMRSPVGAARRACPECSNLLRPMWLLEKVPLDECDAHGIWFDTNELSLVLAAAALPRPTWLELFAQHLAVLR